MRSTSWAVRAGLLAGDYNKVVRFVAFAIRDGIISGARFADRAKKDLSATDPGAEQAASTVKKAVIFAKAQTLSFFDKDTRAVETLKPMLRSEINQSQGPST